MIVTQLTAANLAGVTNVETLAFNGSVTLSADLSFDTLDLSNGASPDSVTFSTGYTNATTVKVDAGDTAVNSAKIVMAVTGSATDLESADNTIITGSATAADSMTITAVSSKTVATSSRITNVDSITVKDGGDAALTAGADFTIDLSSYATKLTIDASALDVAAYDSDLNGKINASDASNEILTITGTASAALKVIGGGADDTIVGSSAAGDNIAAGAGDDTIDMGANLDYTDVIDGGANGLTGTGDTLKVAIDQNDINFMNVTNVETLAIDEAGTSTNTLGAYFTTSGITKVNLDPDDVSTISAAGTTAGVTYVARGAVDEAITAGLGNDTFVFGAVGTLDANDVINGGAGDDTLAISNVTNGGVAVTVDLANVTKVETIATTDADGGDTTSFDADPVTVNLSAVANNAAISFTGTISGASITDSKDVFTVDASSVSDLDYNFTIIGGAGADILTGGSGSDTIQGGSGADVITGGAGVDSLTGGDGKDDFVFALASSQSTIAKTDTITDFETGSDEVRISFTGTGGAVYDFTNKGEAADTANALSLMSGVKGQYYYNTTTKSVVLDTDGNGLTQSGDFEVVVGITELGVADVAMDFTSGTSANTFTSGGGNDTAVAAYATDSLTMGAGNDKISVSGVTYTGTLAFGTGTDPLAVTAASADVKGAKVSGLSAITVVNSGSLTISAAQLTTFNGTDSFAITGVSSEVVTIAAGTGASTETAASITATEIDFDFTSDNAADVLIGNSGDDNFNIVGSTGVATITGGTGTLDMITTSGADYDATADTITGIEKITLGAGYDISITTAQLSANALSAVVGTAGATEELKISGADGAVDTINTSGITFTNSQLVIDAGTGADVLTLGTGTASITLVSGDSTEAAADTITGFTVASHTLNFDSAAGDHLANLVATSVAAATTEAGDTVTVALTDGVFTIAGADAANLDTIGAMFDAAEIVATAIGTAAAANIDGALAFEFGGDTYVLDYTWTNGTTTLALDNATQLIGLTGVTALATSAAANTIIIG